MGIEKLTSSLVGEAQKESKEIVKTAEWHVDKMLKEEQSKEASYKEAAESGVNDRLSAQRNERLAWARLEAKRVLAEAKEDAISASLEGFFTELKEIRNSAKYKDFLKKSVADAVKELGGKPTVHVSKEDTAVLGKLSNADIATDLEGLGGAMVETEDGSVRIDLRLENLFDMKRDSMRKEVYGKIFG